ncbi:MAG TPA: glycoside hydrolase family 27 protein [Opitutaceae bacterium]|nr:glycoside hydrolase family 27 protein [Opitutaceae bacterium]HPO01536.1 glycoside hydrolase family 27 protein [Opitutaceae bacterium]HQL20619.1 glycoside hydrolase family 27 protein [Opitutaceae bacterium]
MKKLLCLFLGLASIALAQKFTGLAPTPPMGWNSWNTFAGDVNESVVRETAEAMIKNGMRDAGYNYLVIDDTWSLKERDAQGNLVADPAKFPSGMKALADYLHANGFKLGIYSCAGTLTCGGYPGSWGNEFQDARTFASWGIDYLKYDWCSSGTANPQDAYKRIRDGIHAAGRPMILSICEWGGSKPWEWAADVGHLWRTTGDIYDSYDGKKGWEMGWKKILDLQYDLVTNSQGSDGLAKYAGPDHWNDPDMMEVGSHGLTFAESRAHFTFWCILAAPLMAGNDLRHMTPEICAVLTDKDALAVNQDALGKQGFRVLAEPAKNIEVWVKELSNGDWAAAALNTSTQEAELTLDWGYFGWVFKGNKYDLYDIWAKKPAGTTETPYKAKVASHDVVFFRLTPKK